MAKLARNASSGNFTPFISNANEAGKYRQRMKMCQAMIKS
jgi:hypothetical protein